MISRSPSVSECYHAREAGFMCSPFGWRLTSPAECGRAGTTAHASESEISLRTTLPRIPGGAVGGPTSDINGGQKTQSSHRKGDAHPTNPTVIG